jgi:two-component system chemotaxis sensor kinase CheA
MHQQDVETLRRRADAAERTADILKAKVLALYNDGPSTSIHKQLERARQREEAAQRRQEVMRARAQELENYSAILEKQVEDRTRTIREILDHVSTGFLLVDREGTILPGHSKSCHRLLSIPQELAGQKLWVVLGLDENERFSYELGFEQIIEDFFPEDTALGQLQDRIDIKDKVLRIIGSVIRDEDNTIDKLLFTLSDITEQIEAERERETSRVLLELLRQRDPFNAFLQDTKVKLELARKAVTLGDEHYTRRVIHTIKGNAGSYGLMCVMETCHDVESREVITHAELHEIEASLREFLQENYPVLGIRYEDNRAQVYEIDAAELLALENLAGQSSDPATAAPILAWIEQARLCPASALLGPLDNFMTQIAQRLEKEIEFEVQGGDVLVDAEMLRPVVMSLTHLLRNAADHGIEPAGERQGKSPRGHISLRFEDRGREHHISVADDGRGIDTNQLAQCALANGILDISEVQQRTSEQLLELIYLDGLSTVSLATEISGRGVGMAAIRAEAERCGGSIHIETNQGEGTVFTLVLPKHHVAAAS